MAKLNQIIALVSGKKSGSESKMTQAYQTAQKRGLFDGLERSYQPKEDGGETLPSESQKVQATVFGLLDTVSEPWTNMLDIVCTQDAGNQTAKANIMVGDSMVAKDVPVTTLIFLEKQLTDILTFINELPVLSDSEDWTKGDRYYISNTITTSKTKKVQKPIVLYAATPEHPAQTQLITEDELVGYWNTKKLSGAIPFSQKQQWIKKTQMLKDAVVKAREEANSISVENKSIGQDIFSFIFQ